MRKAIAGILGAALVGCGGGSDPPAIALDTNVLSFSATEGGADPASQQVTLTNAGDGVISWVASCDKPWLQVWPPSGTTTTETDALSISVIVDQADAWSGPISASGAPSARHASSAIWTGSQMVVWGGSAELSSTGVRNTGGLYDPLSDSWTGTVSTDGAPLPRHAHVAIWTGSEMIVWGGWGGTLGFFDDGARYDPVSDTWVGTTSTVGAPLARESHKAVWTGTEMILWGGWDGSQHLNTGGRYDPVTDSWAGIDMTAGAPTARQQHSAVWTGTDMIVWGGKDDGGRVNTGSRYNPTTNTWTPTTSTGAPVGRQGHAAVWTGTEMIVWGGSNDTGLLDDGARYDPVADAWLGATTSAGAPGPRSEGGVVWTGAGMIIWGGYDGGLLNSGWSYVPPLNLAADTYAATITVSDPNVSNSPQVIYVSLTVSPP